MLVAHRLDKSVGLTENGLFKNVNLSKNSGKKSFASHQ